MSNRNKGEKEEAEWQLALNLQEKKLLEGMKEVCNSMSDNLKSFLSVELNDIKREINSLKKEMQDANQRIGHLESKKIETNKVVNNLREQNKKMQASITALECKASDNSLRLRGVIEEKGEDIAEIISGLFAEYLAKLYEEVALNLNSVYRVNSKFAVQNLLPRDAVVQFTNKKMKKEIISKSFKEPLELEGKSIKVLKELPKKVIDSRKTFRPLSDKLKKMKIRFKWEIPIGVSFFFKGKRKIVTNKEEMWEITKEFEKEATNNAAEREEEGELTA